MTDDNTALLAELRAEDARIREIVEHAGVTYTRTLDVRAADAIEALQAEVADLKKWWGRSVRATEKREQERDAYAAAIEAECGEVSPAAAQVLAARDRRVAAEALRKASSLTTDADRVFHNSDDVRDWLRARADQIENGGAA